MRYARWTAEFFAGPRHQLTVALDGTEVVGMASVVHYVHPDKPREFWVNEVGVAPTHQRRGIGRQLLSLVRPGAGLPRGVGGHRAREHGGQKSVPVAGGEGEPMVVVKFRLRAEE